LSDGLKINEPTLTGKTHSRAPPARIHGIFDLHLPGATADYRLKLYI